MVPTKLLAIITCTTVAAGLLAPAPAHAQRRRGTRVAPVRTAVVVRAAYGPRFYDPYWYGPGWYGGGFPYAWYQPWGYPWRYDYASAIRFEVKPKETEVFVDGYYTGTVDDFDGVFQRLRLEPGQHDIELFLNGHRSLRRSIYLQPGVTFRLRHLMEPLQPGDAASSRPVGTAGATAPPPGPYGPGGRPPLMGPGRPGPPSVEPGRPDAPRDQRPPAATFGALAIRVQPADAEILIDGERWQGPGTGDRLVIQLPDGDHRVEVRKSGFEVFATTVRIRRGETTPLNVSLTRE